MSTTPITDQIRQQLQGVVIWIGKAEQLNSAMYLFYKQGATA